MTQPSDSGFRRLVVILAIGASALVAGCGSILPPTVIAIPTNGPTVTCPLAEVFGRLVRSDQWGIAFGDDAGRVRKVIWPNGYHGVNDGDRVALVDGSGQIVAHVGDTIHAAGGAVGPTGDADHTTLVCSDIVVSTQ